MAPLINEDDDALRVAIQVRVNQQILRQLDTLLATWIQQTGLRVSRAQAALRCIEEGLRVLLAPERVHQGFAHVAIGDPAQRPPTVSDPDQRQRRPLPPDPSMEGGTPTVAEVAPAVDTEERKRAQRERLRRNAQAYRQRQKEAKRQAQAGV
jgi:hypothetical protein